MVPTFKKLDPKKRNLRSRLILIVFTAVIASSNALTQEKSDKGKSEDPAVHTVRFLLTQPSGFSIGAVETQSDRLGDQVGIALLKIFSSTEIVDPQNIRKFLPIIRSAFLHPTLIPTQYRKPKVTLHLLETLDKDINDIELKRQIASVSEFVREQTKPHPFKQQTPQRPPQISGIVLGEDGKPIAGAKVYARPSGQPTNGRVNSVLTDGDGKFFLGSVSPGINTVHAFKEDDGYPDTFFAFYVTDSRAIPQVIVSEHGVANVLVQLGPRATKISIHVSDADTDESIEDAKVELRRPDDPNLYVSLSCIPDANGRCEIFLPASPSKIKVSGPGYEDQDVTEIMQSPNPEIGTTKQVAIRMRRIKSGAR